MNYYLRAWENYINFSGRDTRKQFWMFVLINFIVSVIIGMVDASGNLSNLYTLAILLPTFAIAARRLHDTGRSGWWQLLGLIPIIGWIILIIWYATDSKPGSNQYGANPKSTMATPATPTAV